MHPPDGGALFLYRVASPFWLEANGPDPAGVVAAVRPQPAGHATSKVAPGSERWHRAQQDAVTVGFRRDQLSEVPPRASG